MTMKHLIRNALVCTIVGCIATAALGGEAIQIRLKDGSRWRGEVSHFVELKILQQGIEVELKGRIVKAAAWYITVEGDIAGETGRKTIFKDDILAIRTVQAEAAADAAAAHADGSTAHGAHGPADSANADPHQPGVFVLPLENTVGIYLRHEEIEKIAEEADKYGPGQTIVFIIDSPGGMVTETETIHQTLTDGVEQRVIESLDETLPGIDWGERARYAMGRVVLHGRRRAEEMREAAQMIEELGLAPLMASAIAERQDWVADLGLNTDVPANEVTDYRDLADLLWRAAAPNAT